jgi:putative oxidoreductase
MGFITDRFVAVENTLHGALVRHGITALRLTVGAVFLGFGFLKFFPGVSPAQGLAIRTIDLLTFGLVPWQVGIVAIAVLECFIGICLLANRWMRLAIWLLALELVGVLAPVALLTGRLFSGPHHAPTLEGQYVLKDVILVAAAMVIAAGTFRGGRLVRDEPQPVRASSRAPSTSWSPTADHSEGDDSWAERGDGTGQRGDLAPEAVDCVAVGVVDASGQRADRRLGCQAGARGLPAQPR